MRISEVSPNTLDGSFSDDLVISKIWLLKHVSEINQTYGTIYVLGSWFGNLAMLMAARDLSFERIINVDLDGKALSIGDDLMRKLGLDGKVESLRKDANELSYDQLDGRGLVVNTSCNNIEGRGWFDNIPSGTMLALQGRDNDQGAKVKQHQTSDLVSSYPLSEILFEGEIELMDDDGPYRRFMLIGIR